ncbi:hypothetical protein [Streptomyces sp. CC210A]|uniref:hypothetical protein n=1 Tax=Streptomyces sp. CC210A TaxID=2898184 RepID=UPI001F2F669B|nr:hypothetical protein [Streptomyces sp. CC210A]
MTGCCDMYGGASRLLRQLTHRAAANPVAGHRRRERQCLYAYLTVMVAGTAACLGPV